MKPLTIKAICLISLIMCANYADAGWNSSETQTTVEAHLKRHLAHGAVPVRQLAALISRLAKKYDIDQNLISKVLLQESRGLEYAYNAKSDDHGIMQINGKTADSRHISMSCLYDWKCNLEQGVRIISDLQLKKDFRICLYNVGPHGAAKHMDKCINYERKLACLN